MNEDIPQIRGYKLNSNTACVSGGSFKKGYSIKGTGSKKNVSKKKVTGIKKRKLS
jgi:hypothetical protein